MAYYMMTENDVETFWTIRAEARQAYMKIAEAVRESMGFETGRFSSYNDKHADPEGYRAYCQLSARVEKEVTKATRGVVADYDAKIGAFFSGLIQVPAKTKAEVCKLGARYAQNSGLVEAEILNITKPRDYDFHDMTQHWYVYVENGIWYQKMHKSNKARHEIAF